ncbi:BTB/POZ domain-containing protein 2-like [Saccostrea cucullata]|uniref:BTB/POZ domain-containing protein 2-like n=1 Tax=Saccostrea cuccullata TaxID=36930 RepID=UPI002ED5C547
MAVLGNKLIELFKDQLYCDVNIKLRDGAIQAHRVVLILGSDWFAARLSENWESASKDITCNVHSTAVMKSMIEFLYSSYIETSVENVEEIYQVADYYGVKELLQRCIDFMQDSISLKNSLKMLLIAHNNEITSTKAQCLQFVDNHIEDLFQSASEDFLDLPLGLLKDIIRRDSLCVHEEVLFENINLWVSMAGEEHRRVALWKEVIPDVRFGRMSMDFFLDHILTKSVLEDAFSLLVLRHLSTLDDALPLQYTRKRQNTTCNDIVVNRFRNISHESTWVVDDSLDGDRISFTVNLDNMKLKGLLVYGRAGAYGIFSVLLYTNHSQTLLCKTQVKEQCSDELSILILFPKPVFLLRDTEYTAVLRINGGPTSYGVGGLHSASFAVDENTNLTVKFSTAVGGNTNVNNGQIKGLIFKKA